MGLLGGLFKQHSFEEVAIELNTMKIQLSFIFGKSSALLAEVAKTNIFSPKAKEIFKTEMDTIRDRLKNISALTGNYVYIDQDLKDFLNEETKKGNYEKNVRIEEEVHVKMQAFNNRLNKISHAIAIRAHELSDAVHKVNNQMYAFKKHVQNNKDLDEMIAHIEEINRSMNRTINMEATIASDERSLVNTASNRIIKKAKTKK